jgi:hypothetical protein
MKLFRNLLLLLATAFICVQMSCGGDDPDPIPVAKETAESLSAGTWVPSTVNNEGTPREEWPDFTLTFSANAANDYLGGTYATSGLPSEEDASLVWKTSGSWAFKLDENGEPLLNTIIRDNDGIELTVTVGVDDVEAPTNGNLSLSFTVPEQGSRAEGFFGLWEFSFGLQQ